MRERFAADGIDPNRIEFTPFLPLSPYFALYSRIDIALDPFPYTGGTTTCDALWMGVPVISVTGKTAVSRGGLSILSNLGHPDWVASTPEDYIRIAADLSADLPRLAQIRSSLRERMRNSPLMDAPQFARDMEAAYRMMWREWCRSQRGEAGTRA